MGWRGVPTGGATPRRSPVWRRSSVHGSTCDWTPRRKSRCGFETTATHTWPCCSAQTDPFEDAAPTRATASGGHRCPYRLRRRGCLSPRQKRAADRSAAPAAADRGAHRRLEHGVAKVISEMAVESLGLTHPGLVGAELGVVTSQPRAQAEQPGGEVGGCARERPAAAPFSWPGVGQGRGSRA